MPIFQVEMTSENPWAPDQLEIDAATPWDAIQEAMSRRGIDFNPGPAMLANCPDDDANGGSYRGWSRLSISVDARVEADGTWVHEADYEPPRPSGMEQLAKAEDPPEPRDLTLTQAEVDLLASILSYHMENCMTGYDWPEEESAVLERVIMHGADRGGQ